MKTRHDSAKRCIACSGYALPNTNQLIPIHEGVLVGQFAAAFGDYGRRCYVAICARSRLKAACRGFGAFPVPEPVFSLHIVNNKVHC